MGVKPAASAASPPSPRTMPTYRADTCGTAGKASVTLSPIGHTCWRECHCRDGYTRGGRRGVGGWGTMARVVQWLAGSLARHYLYYTRSNRR